MQNRDLFLTNIRFLRGGSGASSHNSLPGKLGSMVQSVTWNSECNMLAAIHDSRFSVFLYPTVIYVDRGLLGKKLNQNYLFHIAIIYRGYIPNKPDIYNHYHRKDNN